MAIQELYGEQTGSGLQFDLGTDDSLIVGPDGFLVNVSTAGGLNENLISALGSLQVVTILGTAYSYGDAILLGDSPSDDASQRLSVGVNGYVGSQTGVAAYLRCSAGTVENWGTIDGNVGVAVVSGSASDPTTIENHGVIRGRGADAVYVSSLGTTSIINSGTIFGGNESALDAISTAGSISIVNTGTIKGLMEMGSGADTYDGRLGSADGLVDGNGGGDTLRGGTGGDKLSGGTGRDLLYGGGGADMFVYVDTGESTSAKAGRDLIGDFSHRNRDIIDLADVDALAATGADDDFTFIGRAAFSAGGAEVRYAIKGSSTFVYLNTDTDKPPEMTIELSGRIHLVASDFDL